MWDVEAVEGEETVEYDVTQDGEVTETEREADKDDLDKANRAEVSIGDAITTALEGRDGQTVDDVELDDEDGTLVWEIDFDDADGNDADEVYVDAVTGDIVNG
ncbi:PepSY domain-containing protein [Micrococcus lylae]|nr:PepSY domain-containing protein [Micrococcus lylae]MCT2072250.1 PepSY domain-containing protein [Micrococcus lylae]